MEPEFYKYFGISVDLAIEAHDIVRGQLGREIPGAVVDKEKYKHCVVTTVKILQDKAVQLIGKPKGNYITIESPALRDNDRSAQQEVAEVLARKLAELLNIPENANVLLVGLGNWHATPDALGPRVIDKSMVTRHLYHYAPDEIKDGMRSVCAIAPGVLGLTGIETAEIIKGVVEKVQPELIIVVDALAAGSVERIATTIQIADSGISPGSGTGSGISRSGINAESMGVPVIALGVPTVVHAAIIARSAIDKFLEQIQETPVLDQIYKSMRPDFLQSLIENILRPYSSRLVVTPKEIDSLILNISKVVAGGISMALHPSISHEEYTMYLN